MKISRNWLQTFFETPLPSAEALSDALTFHAFEIDGVEKLGDDDILDVKVTPNRGHDALSHRGIAKEISAILKLPLAKDPFATTPDLSSQTKSVRVSIEDSNVCLRYVAAHIKGVKVGPSPEWLQARLAAMGSRSVNNVVDATNYVMFHTGQPLHAFDAARLTVKDGVYSIGVRFARAGEKITSLENREYTLQTSNLVIADMHADAAIGIAGVKGGLPAGVSESTTEIIIESANFEGVSVRKTAKALNLRTDASSRYEQVISPELCGHGMRMVVDLILQIAGGELIGFADKYPAPQGMESVAVTAAHAEKLLGVRVDDSTVRDVFTRLGFTFTEHEGVFTVTPPFERLDIHIPEDLIEEIGRIVGYEGVEAKELPQSDLKPQVNPHLYTAEKIRAFLMGEGFSEVLTSVFVNDGKRTVLNKVDGDRPHLRSSLLPGLQAALERNDHVKEAVGLRAVRLFEIGVVWHENHEEMFLALGVLGNKKSPKPGAVIAALAEHLSVPAPTGLPTGNVVEISLEILVPAIPDSYAALEPSRTERVQPFSRYPFIVRDIALWVAEGTKAADVQKVIADAAGPLMLRIDQFDEFTKEGRTSFAFRLVLQSFEKTLTDDEAHAVMTRVYDAVKAQGWEVR